jgi:DNA primase
MFPIHNAKGNVIAFGGRVLSNKDNPKYLNSPETPLFSKSKELYGLYHCRKYSRRIDYILVVEGYMDVIALHQQGITSTVATLGTATTPAHLQTLSRSTGTIVFCFDGDKAGRAAAWKALQTSLPVITAGLVIKFLILPEGEDPDTLIKHESSKSFTKRIEAAQTLSSFLFDHIKSEVPFETIEGKTLFLEKSALLIHQINYPIYRQQLIEGVAQTIGQDVSHVEKALTQSALSKPPVFDRQVNKVDDFTDTTPKEVKNASVGSNMKGLMSKMISCVINYPSLVNDPESSGVIEERAKKLPKSDVLIELIHSAQIEPDITKESLIKPYENKNMVFSRLKKLSVMEPFLSENEAKTEFLSALTAAENHQQRKSTKTSILSAKTKAEEKKIADDIIRRKMSSGYKNNP